MLKLLFLAVVASVFVSKVSSYYSPSDDDDDVVEEFKDTFPILFIILTSINFLLNSICIIQTIRSGKFRRDAKYVFILNYLVLKTVHGAFRCVSLLMSSKLLGAKLYIMPNNWLCQIIYFFTFFFESSEVFMLTLIWLVLFSERKLLGFQSLYADLNGTSSKNTRRIVLIVFYVLIAILTGFSATFTRTSYWSGRTCMLDGAGAAIISLGFIILYCPALFSLAEYSTLFWKVFGGIRDPIKTELNASTRSFLKFIKINCMLKVLEFFFMDIQSSQGFFYNSLLTEIFRVLGLSVVFISAVLYLYFESSIPFLQYSPMETSFMPPSSIISDQQAEENAGLAP